jgi:phenylacetate-CoA ligase
MAVMKLPDWLSGLLAHAYANAPATRTILDAAGVRPSAWITDAALEHIPITRKDTLIELQAQSPPFGGFLAVPEEHLAHVFLSPGPLFDPQGPGPDYWRFAQALRAAGFQSGEIVLNSSAYHLTPMGHMFDDAAREVGCVVVPGGVGNTELQTLAARRLGATAYCGTPSFLQALLERAPELRLRHAFVAGEMLPTDLRAAIEARNVLVFQGYGTADLGCLGFECTEHNGFHIPDGVLVEIVDPTTGTRVAPGDPGEVVATVNSRVYPLLRFGTGDLSALDERACACGRGSPRLMGIRGRIGDAVKVRGMFVHPRQLADVVARFPQVTRYQAIVERAQHSDRLRLLLEAPAIPADLVHALREVLHVRPDLELVPSGVLADGGQRIADRRIWGPVL